MLPQALTRFANRKVLLVRMGPPMGRRTGFAGRPAPSPGCRNSWAIESVVAQELIHRPVQLICARLVTIMTCAPDACRIPRHKNPEARRTRARHRRPTVAGSLLRAAYCFPPRPYIPPRSAGTGFVADGSRIPQNYFHWSKSTRRSASFLSVKFTIPGFRVISRS